MIRLITILFALMLILPGCHSDTIKEPRPIDLVLNRIGGTWKIISANLEGVKITEAEKGSVSFFESQSGDLIYFITEGMYVDEHWPWPISGTLNIADDPNSKLVIVESGHSFDYSIENSQLHVRLLDRTPGTGEVITEIIPQWNITLEREITP